MSMEARFELWLLEPGDTTLLLDPCAVPLWVFRGVFLWVSAEEQFWCERETGVGGQ